MTEVQNSQLETVVMCERCHKTLRYEDLNIYNLVKSSPKVTGTSQLLLCDKCNNELVLWRCNRLV